MKKYFLPFILFLAGTLRLLAIYSYGDFWFDEMFSFTYAQKTWADSISRFWIWETNPPLYTLALKLWLFLGPTTEFFVRLPSLIFGTVTVYIIYLWLKPTTNERMALLGALFLTLSPYHIFLSATARPYALLLLLGTASTYLFWTTFINQSQKKWWPYTVITLLLLYTHYTAWSLFICHAVITLLLTKHSLKKWLRAVAPAIIAWLVWAVPSLLAKIHGGGFTSSWYFNLSSRPKNIAVAIQPLLTTYSWWPVTLILFIIIFGGSIYLLYKKKFSADSSLLTLLIIQSFFPILFAGVMNVWNIKFFVISLPFFVALVSYLIVKTFTYLPLQIIIILFFTIPGTYYLIHQNLPLENWSTVTKYINENAPSSSIFIYNNFVYKNQFDRYYQGQIPSLAYLNTTTINWDYRLITQNYWRYTPSDAELATWYNENELGTYHDIFIMMDTTVDIPLQKLVEQRGYKQVTAPFYPRLVIPSPIYHYAKSETTTPK